MLVTISTYIHTYIPTNSAIIITYRRRLACGVDGLNGSEEVILSLGQGGAQLCHLGLVKHRVQSTSFILRIAYYHRRGA